MTQIYHCFNLLVRCYFNLCSYLRSNYCFCWVWNYSFHRPGVLNSTTERFQVSVFFETGSCLLSRLLWNPESCRYTVHKPRQLWWLTSRFSLRQVFTGYTVQAVLHPGVLQHATEIVHRLWPTVNSRQGPWCRVVLIKCTVSRLRHPYFIPLIYLNRFISRPHFSVIIHVHSYILFLH